MKLYEGYPYYYETHLHTSESSRCAVNTGEEMAAAAKEAGYTGIFVTDHNWGGNCRPDKGLPWNEWVTEFAHGYEHAEECGKRIGLDVFWGYEATHDGHDFLIYGVTPGWMKEHPELHDADVKRQYEIIHAAGGMVIQAHPYREASYIKEIKVYPYDVDGVEIINASHSNHRYEGTGKEEYDRKAIAYAAEYGLHTTAGSDVHSTDIPGGGMAFRHRIGSVKEYMDAVKDDEDYILTNGDTWFDKHGNILS